MPDVKILTDEHVPRTVVRRLVSFGIEVDTLEDSFEKGLSDREIVERAKEDDMIILTMDSDFLEIAGEDVGVLYFTKRVSKKKMAADIIKVLNTLTYEDIKGEIIYLPWSKKDE